MSVRGGINHLDLTVSDPTVSEPFYDVVLGAIGFEPRRLAHGATHLPLYHSTERGQRLLSIALQPARHARAHDRYSPGLHHVAFTAASREDVDRLHALLVSIGATVLDPPAEYPEYAPGYYAVFFADPDGLKLEFVHMPSEPEFASTGQAARHAEEEPTAHWRGSRAASRRRFAEKYDAAEADAYHAGVGALAPELEDAYLADLSRVAPLRRGLSVLDAGAGTGTVSRLLARVEGVSITALEPAPAMAERLRAEVEPFGVAVVEGFCDAPEDRGHFAPASFDLIVSRQLGNALFDPLAAFENWRHWLVPGGAVVVIDGLYPRDAWPGRWEEEVDVLPLSACQTTALVPYLLETAGYRVESVGPMTAVNAMPATRTPRYVVVARRPDAP